MFKNIENLKIENIIKGSPKKKYSKVCRKDYAFFIRIKGSVNYTFSDNSFDVKAGDIIFLPKDSEYTFRVCSDTECEYVAIRFDADITDARPFVYSLDGFADMYEFENNISELWKFGGQSEHYKCYSLFYSLLNYIENLDKLSYIDKKKSGLISPAVLYLKNHIYDCDLKVETMVTLCGISATYFNKIFHASYGVSPQSYILSKRLSHAKAIIDSGDFDTITEIAFSVGYNDPLYFSRVFKKKYGVSPSKYAKG